MKRLFKQFVYAILYIAIFAAIVFLAQLLSRPASSCFNGIKDSGEQGIDCGGVCSKVCSPETNGIQVNGQPHIFHPTPSSISVIAEVQNNAQGLAAKKFDYEFTFRDAGGNVIAGEKIDGTSFIYASEIKYVAELNYSFPGMENIASADFSVIGEPEWTSESLFSRPQLDLQNKNVSSSESGVSVTGNFINNGNVPVGSVTALAVFYGNLGQIAGVSKTEIDNVMPAQQRQFSISHPPLGNLDAAGTKIFLYGE